MMVSVFSVSVPGPAAGKVKVHLVWDCDPDHTRDLPKVDEVVVLSYTDGSAKVSCGPNITLDEVIEMMGRAHGVGVESVTIRGRIVYTLVPKNGILGGVWLVDYLKGFVHLCQRQDPEVLRSEWEARQQRRQQQAQRPPNGAKSGGDNRRKDGGKGRHQGRKAAVKPDRRGNNPGTTLGDLPGAAKVLKGLKPTSTPVVIVRGQAQTAKPTTAQPPVPPTSMTPPPSPAQVAGEKASDTIARLMTSEAGKTAVTAACMAYGVPSGSEIPAAKMKEVAEMALLLAG